MSKISTFIKDYIFGPKLWVNENWHADPNHVAAGDPAHGGHVSDVPPVLSHPVTSSGQTINLENYKEFIVDGSSMSPENVSNGDMLLCEPTTADTVTNVGDYVIVKVDEEYYEKKGKKVNFDYKLRRILYNVGINPNFEELLNKLRNVEDSVLIPENEQALKKKFLEIYKYYDASRPMMLSVTYRGGNIRYSFHPSDLIKFVARYVVKDKDTVHEL